MKYHKCTDAACSSTTGAVKNLITSFLKLKKPEEVYLAESFRPLDGDQKTYPIVFDCPQPSEYDHMVITDRDTRSASDRKKADLSVVAANNALEESKSAQNEVIMTIRPLFACCQSNSCKAQILSAGIRFNSAPAEGGKTAD